MWKTLIWVEESRDINQTFKKFCWIGRNAQKNNQEGWRRQVKDRWIVSISIRVARKRKWKVES